MPKLNVVGMIVLSLAVAAGAAVMALRTGTPRPDPQVDRLIRRLGDTDPDLRREAERELKDLGRVAEPALKKAAEGADLAVAERAKIILGIRPKPESAPAGVRATPEAGVRLTLQIASAPARADEPLMYYLRLHNGSKRSISVARHLREGAADYRAFGIFERIDAEGRVTELGGERAAEGEVEFVLVAPGDTVDLFPAAGVLKIGASGTYRLRYVYDATEGSEYRARVSGGHFAGSALPGERLESNAVTITVP